MSQKSQNNDKTKYLRFYYFKTRTKTIEKYWTQKNKTEQHEQNHESGDFAKDVGVFSFCQWHLLMTTM
jgi:hypothetical protein